MIFHHFEVNQAEKKIFGLRYSILQYSSSRISHYNIGKQKKNTSKAISANLVAKLAMDLYRCSENEQNLV